MQLNKNSFSSWNYGQDMGITDTGTPKYTIIFGGLETFS